jgi:hypothetical protein
VTFVETAAIVLLLAGILIELVISVAECRKYVRDLSLLAKDRRSRPTNGSVASVMGPTLLWYLIASSPTSAPTVSARSDRPELHLGFS